MAGQLKRRKGPDGKPVGNYYFIHQGRSYTTGTNKLKWATKKMNDLMADLIFPGRTIKAIKFKDIVDPYMAWASARKKPSTVKGERSCMVRLVAYFSETRTDRISDTEIQRYILKRRGEGVKGGTVNRELSCLSSIMEYAVTERRAVRVPQIKRLSEADAGRRDMLTADEVATILEHLDERARLAALIMFHTGLRVSTVCSMTWAMVDLEARTFRLPPSNVKQGKAQTVMLSAELVEVLKASRSEGRVVNLHPHTVGHWIRAAMFDAEIGKEGTTCHGFRHGFITDLLSRGVPVHVVQQAAGHADISMTGRYAHALEEQQRAAVESRSLTGKGKVIPMRREG